MYSRLIQPPKDKSFFLFGPRGTGKTTWVKSHFKTALYLDLLEAEIFNDLLANPQRLGQFIPKGFKDWAEIEESGLQSLGRPRSPLRDVSFDSY